MRPVSTFVVSGVHVSSVLIKQQWNLQPLKSHKKSRKILRAYNTHRNGLSVKYAT